MENNLKMAPVNIVVRYSTVSLLPDFALPYLRSSV